MPPHLNRTGINGAESGAYLALERKTSLRNYLERRSGGARQGRRVMRPYEQDVLFHYLLGATNLRMVFRRMRSFYFMLKERLGNGIWMFETSGSTIYMCITSAWRGEQKETMKYPTLQSLEPILYFLQWAIDCKIDFVKVAVPWPADETTPRLLANISSRIVFDADRIRIGLHTDLLERPVVRAVDELSAFYALLPCYSAVGFSSSASSQAHLEKLVSIFFETHQRMPRLADLAAMTNHSHSTLKRRLQACGLSYRDLINNAKYTCACSLLKNTSYTIKEIAYRVGYTDHNSFRRFFRQRSGMPPSRWREL